MRTRYFEHRKARVEIIPMIDVMLFLLVFFIIVTLQMIPDAGVNMQLPQSSQAQHLPHPKIVVTLLQDGTIKVKDNTLSAAALTALLAADGNPAKTEVTIAADKAVQFQHFITVMDAARAAGVSDIGVAAQAVPGASPADAGAPALPAAPEAANPAPGPAAPPPAASAPATSIPAAPPAAAPIPTAPTAASPKP